jgi:hypothetical protein
MAESKARQPDINKWQNKKLMSISNVPIQATILETPEGESHISQCMRPNSAFPLHSRFNAVRASVMNKFVKASRIIVMTIPFTTNVN